MRVNYYGLIWGLAVTLDFLNAHYADANGAFTICENVASFGAKRWATEPNEHLSDAERVKLAFEYADISFKDGRPAARGAVSKLAWQWGLNCHGKCIRDNFRKGRYGKTIGILKRTTLKDKICDSFVIENTLIDILVKKKGRVNKQRLPVLLRKQTGVTVSPNTIVRKLRELKVIVKRRRYCLILTPVQKLTRYYFGAAHSKERFRYWIDLDEKWFYCVRIKGFVWILPEYMSAKLIKRLPVQSKRYITKVMFLTVVARPIFCR